MSREIREEDKSAKYKYLSYQSLAALKFASQKYEHDAHEDHGQVVVHLATAAVAAVAVAPRLICRRMDGGVIGAALVPASAESLGKQDRCLLGLRVPVSG